MSPRFLHYLPLASFLLLAACAPSPPTATIPTNTMTAAAPTQDIPIAPDAIQGRVFDENNPMEGATVRIQASENYTFSDTQGHFELDGLEPDVPVTISAWKDGYYCAKAEDVQPGGTEVALALTRYQTTDNPDYEWVSPVGKESCYSCKPALTQVWLDEDAHAQSALNPRYLSMYQGTDLKGNQSPLTQFVSNPDYGRVPILPNPNEPYFGPGYKLDFPQTDGNCAACHNPGAALGDPYAVDPAQVEGVERFGVHCDLCHKIADVLLIADSGLPQPNMPGVLSMDVRRPFPEDEERFQLFFGTFDDDNVPEEDTYLPLIEESQFCAPCHYGVFWDTVIYNSFGEWLESPYSDLQIGQTCQDCHMPSPTIYEGNMLTNVAPDAGGVERDPLSLHAHTFPGASDEDLLQNAVSMDVSTIVEDGQLVVDIALTNDQTGHHVPSDSPLRHLILLVQTVDAQGESLEQTGGPVLPEWTGVGDPAEGYVAGLPGKAYAKVLMELWTEISPSGSYWNPTIILEDTRLAAFQTDTSRYTFALPTGAASLDVHLLYRRAYIKLADQKGWQDADILMEHFTTTIP
jgi:hypothetical protein